MVSYNSEYRDMTVELLNRCVTQDNACSSKFFLLMDDILSAKIELAMLRGLCSSNNIPSCPEEIISSGPPHFVAITGSPQAIASMREMENPSDVEQSKNISIPCNI